MNISGADSYAAVSMRDLPRHEQDIILRFRLLGSAQQEKARLCLEKMADGEKS